MLFIYKNIMTPRMGKTNNFFWPKPFMQIMLKNKNLAKLIAIMQKHQN